MSIKLGDVDPKRPWWRRPCNGKLLHLWVYVRTPFDYRDTRDSQTLCGVKGRTPARDGSGGGSTARQQDKCPRCEQLLAEAKEKGGA